MENEQNGVKPEMLRISKPKIDLNRCQKNYRCFVFCPRDAIEIKPNGFPFINYDQCDGCLICLRECPATAIVEETSSASKHTDGAR